MKKITLLLLAIGFGFCLFASNESVKRVVLSGDGETQIELLSNDKQSSVIEFKINEYQLQQIANLKGNSYAVSLPKGSAIQQKGAPDLAKLTSSLIVSETKEMKVEVVYSDFVEIKNIDVSPSRGNLYRNMDIENIPFKEGDVYKRNTFFPGKLAELRDPYIVRDFRGQTVVTYPLQYNPVKRVLRIYTKIQVRVLTTHKQGKNQMRHANTNGINNVFKQVYKNQFLNYSDAKYDPVDESGNMLIVCHPDYVEEMTPFIKWKTQKGISVELVEFGAETIGTSATALKTYLADYYNTKGLTYLLLVGDAEDIPSLSQSGDSDVAYSYVTGNDSYPEFFVGRFSAENSNHVKTQVDKVIFYERDIDKSATWLKNAIGIASDEGAGGAGDDSESDIQHMNNIKTDLVTYGYDNVAEVYDPGATASEVTNDVNSGVSVINYVGHGSDFSWVTSGFSVSNCNALTNIHKYPYIFDVACVNGNFHGQTCFAEAWSRATHDNSPTGSIAIIASTINQSWAPPMDGQDEMVDLLIESYENNIKRSFGGIVYNGCMHMNDEYGAEGAEMTDTWTTFGDPSVIVRTTTPQEMTVSHDEEILIGVSEFNVNVNANGAAACLSLDGKILGVATVIDGVAKIEIEPLTEVVKLDLIITGYNKVTYQSKVNVIPAEGPYLSVNEFTIVDANANGEIEYGESFGIELGLRNVGTENSTAITVSITSTSEYVETITENTNVEFNDIEAGAEEIVRGKFQVQLVDSIPDQQAIDFVITINDSYSGKQQYVKTKSVVVNAPVIKMAGIRYNDNFEGNQVNGIIDAGETGEVIFEIENKGHANLSGLQAELSLVSESEYLALNTTFVEVGALEMVSPTVAKFSVTAHEDTPLGHPVSVNLKIKGGVYETTEQADVIIGIVPIFVMGENDEVSLCSGTFYDSGNENANYSENENHTITFKPSLEGNLLEFTFESFDVEAGYDYLHVYNGSSTSANEIEGSPFSGSNAPEKIMAANAEGALTFEFISDGYQNGTGWKATFECVDGTTVPLCASNPNPVNNSSDVLTNLLLTWDAVPGAINYDVYFGETIPTEPNITVNSNNYMAENLDPFTTYLWKVVPKNMAGVSPDNDCGSWSFTTGETAILMKSGEFTTCSALFMDPGGNQNYPSGQNLVTTILPAEDGKVTQVTFSEFNLEEGYDYLYIYNGTSVSDNLIGKYDGSSASSIGNNGTIIATNPEGALTFKFTSDNMVNHSGWLANVSCVERVYNVVFDIKKGVYPLAGVNVKIDGGDFTSNNQGKVQLNLTSGEYTYIIEREGYITVDGNLSLNNNDTVVIIDMISVGVNYNNESSITLYPNPSNGIFNYSGVNAKTINVYNISGKVVAQNILVQDTKIDLAILEQGIYYVEIFDIENNRYIQKVNIIK